MLERLTIGLTAMLLAGWTLFVPPASGTEREVGVVFGNGVIDLAGVLLLPQGEGPFPAAVIVQGSGASDRTNRWSRDVAGQLVGEGLAALLTDKRGAGLSGGDWRTASFSDLAGDVLAAVDLLVARPDIDAGRIGVVGLSQGGQVAPIAAARSSHVSFVVSLSSKAVGFAEGSFLEMANTARQAGLLEADVQEVVRLNLAALRYLTTDNWDDYAAVRGRVLQTRAREIAAGFPSSPDEAIWKFLRSVVDFDPLFQWLQVSQPALLVYGEEDEDDNAPVRESVRRLEHAFRSVNKTNYRILVVPGVGHGLRDPATHRLAPLFTQSLSAWLREFVASP
jgi:dipeptidyl aminopeptidase/acylaminoacyl peptidase